MAGRCASVMLKKRKAASALPAQPPSQDNALLRMLGKRPGVKLESEGSAAEPHRDTAIDSLEHAMMCDDAQSLSLGVSVRGSALPQRGVDLFCFTWTVPYCVIIVGLFLCVCLQVSAIPKEVSLPDPDIPDAPPSARLTRSAFRTPAGTLMRGTCQLTLHIYS